MGETVRIRASAISDVISTLTTYGARDLDVALVAGKTPVRLLGGAARSIVATSLSRTWMNHLLSARSRAFATGDFAACLIGEINSRSGCRTTATLDRAAARSPLFSEFSR